MPDQIIHDLIFHYPENDGKSVTGELQAAGIKSIHVVSVVDHESGIVGWYGIENGSGRIFECIAMDADRARRTPALFLARKMFAAYQDWIEGGKRNWWEV